MKQGLIAGLVVVAILAVGGGLWLASQNKPVVVQETSTPANDLPANGAGSEQSEVTLKDVVEVSYTDSGFEPADVGTVKAGQKVTFTNNSSRSMWVASDAHPEHNDYPGFDQGSAVGKGGSYSFSFDKTGTWGFHNHAANQHQGAVTVVE